MAGLAAITLLATTACAGPPDDLDKAVENAQTQIETAKKANDKARAQFPKLLKQGKYAFMAGYTPQQQHADRFDQASAKLNEAKKAYDKQVSPLVKGYEDKKRGELEKAVGAVNALVADAQRLTADPPQWLDKVAATKANPDSTVRRTVAQASDVQTSYTDLGSDVRTAKQTYPRNASVIDQRFKPLESHRTRAVQAAGLLQVEAHKPQPNYAVMTEKIVTIQNSDTALRDFRSKLRRLDVRETRTLVDVRVISEIEISRTTWDDSGGKESDYDYPPVVVDLDTANYFAKFKPKDENVLAVDATTKTSDGYKAQDADQKQWNKLGINSRSPRWPKDHDHAEFYLSGLEETYCNQLFVLRDGKPDSSGRPSGNNYCSKFDTATDLAQGKYWVEADELGVEDMGMDLYAKGGGDFEDQATTVASPPGMVYVGDETTGEWQEDSNGGGSFWVYYGQYRFFSDLIDGPTPYHYRYEYNEWHRGYRYHGKSYYSKIGKQPRYGMRSPLATSRFPGSKFMNSGLYNMSIRGAGPIARGGGPSGGGK